MERVACMKMLEIDAYLENIKFYDRQIKLMKSKIAALRKDLLVES